MKQEDIEKLEHMCRMYGAYEITKALKDYAIKLSAEYQELGNNQAIIHKDAIYLFEAVAKMKDSHPLRKVTG